MPIKRRKNRSNLIGTFDLQSSRRPHYVRVYLWKAQADMLANVDTNHFNMMPGSEVGDTKACFTSTTWLEDTKTGDLYVRPLLGEIHFVSGNWGTETLAHETQHAIIHRLRVLGPKPDAIFDQHPCAEYGNHEEEICYEAGEWFDKLHRWIWRTDPAMKVTHDLVRTHYAEKGAS